MPIRNGVVTYTPEEFADFQRTSGIVIEGVTVVEDTKGRPTVGAPLTALTKPRKIPKPSAVSQAPKTSTDRRIRGTPYRRDDDTNRPFIVLINPSSPSASQIIDGTKFDSFIMMAFREEDQEKAMISETFGAPHILGTGRMVRRMTFSGTLRTTPTWASLTPPPPPMADNQITMSPQYLLLLEFYSRWLRLSEQLSRGIMTRIVIDQQYFDGYVLNLTSGRDSSSQSFGDFSFSFVCLNQGVIHQLYRRGLAALNDRFSTALASTAKVSAADKKGELVGAENKIKLKLSSSTALDLTLEESKDTYDLMEGGKPATLTVVEGNNGWVGINIEAGGVTGIKVIAKEGGGFPREMTKGIPLSLQITLPLSVPIKYIRITFGNALAELTITVKSTTEVAYVEKEESPMFALQSSPGENYAILGKNAVGKALTPGQMATDIPFTFSVSYRHSGSNALVQPSELLKDELLATFRVVPIPLASIIKTGSVPAVVAEDQGLFTGTGVTVVSPTAVAEGDKIIITAVLRVTGIPSAAPPNRNGATGLQFQFSYEPSKGVKTYAPAQGSGPKPVQFVVAGDLKWADVLQILSAAITKREKTSATDIAAVFVNPGHVPVIGKLWITPSVGYADSTPAKPGVVKPASLLDGVTFKVSRVVSYMVHWGSGGLLTCTKDTTNRVQVTLAMGDPIIPFTITGKMHMEGLSYVMDIMASPGGPIWNESAVSRENYAVALTNVIDADYVVLTGPPTATYPIRVAGGVIAKGS